MEFHRIDPNHDAGRLREFLASSDPEDYLLEDFDEWIRDGRNWVGDENGHWLSFGRLHDLGDGEGWVSGLRVVSSRRGKGFGRQTVGQILADARSIGLTVVRATIENENVVSRHLFERFGFSSVTEMIVRRGRAQAVLSSSLRRAEPDAQLVGPVGWLPGLSGRVDVLPGVDGGRFGRWRPALVERWAREGKLYVGSGLAAAVQEDWWREPRTLWVNPLQGDPASLFAALGSLTERLGHEEWQAFLPAGDDWRKLYDVLGTLPASIWGDRFQLYERGIGP